MSDLGAEQKRAYGKVLRACGLLWSKSFRSQDDITALRELVLDALASVELYLPSTELDMKMHNLLHLVEKVLIVGPAWVTSMFVYESLWALLVHWATNKDTPELTILRSYADFEFGYMSLLSMGENAAMPTSLKLLEELDHKVGVNDFWLPARASVEPLEAVIAKKDLKLSLSLTGNVSCITLLCHLHYLYISVNDLYRREWDEYSVWYKQHGAPAADKSRITGNIKDGFFYPMPCLGRALAVWAANVDYKTWLHEAGRPPPQCVLRHSALSFWRMALGTAKFCVDSLPGKTGDRQWVFSNKAVDNDEMFLGCIQHILHHKGPDNKLNVVIIVDWYENVSDFDPDLLLPTFKKVKMAAHIGQAWFARDIAPVNINVLDHPKNGPRRQERVALHRDSRFVEAAGFRCAKLFSLL